MRRMGIEVLYVKPNTSRRHPQRVIHLNLLRTEDRPNKIRAMDFTYIPMAKGFV